MNNLLFVLLLSEYASGAKILGVFNHPGASHTYLGEFLFKNLAARGHEVTIMTGFPHKENISNYRHIYLPKILADLEHRNTITKSKSISLEDLKEMTLNHTEETFRAPEVIKLLDSDENFDLIVIDWFYNEATLIFGHIYKAPVIYISSFGNVVFLNEFTGNVLPYSYVPGAGQYMTDNMTFPQRLTMTFLNIAYEFLFVPRRNEVYFNLLNRYFRNPPSIESLKENVALVLANSHFSIDTPRPHTPNVVPVGGFHVRRPEKLPPDLKDFLDEANEGAIYFSLGTQRAAYSLTEETFREVFKELARFPQRVLLKHSTDNFPNIPKNIKIVKWAPQIDVLAHPNLKLFITHGGLLSFIEAVHFGVPMICIPFGGDQVTNAAFIESRRIGLHLAPENITDDSLFTAIETILNNSSFKENVDFRSSLLRNQPTKPLDLAIYWVEHVLQYGNGNHLKTFATKLSWYKYYLIDVIAFILSVLFAFVTVIYVVIKLICKVICRKNVSKVKQQ